MLKPLKLNLLGPIEVSRAGEPVIDLITGKTLALLSYLVVTGRPHPRPALAGLLWGGMPEAKARANLSKALSTLRRLLGDHLTITRQAVAFNQASDFWLDVAAFEEKVNSPTIESLQAAVQLYQGNFLDGFYVRNTPEFETWVLGQRARLREMVLQTLHQLSAHFADQGGAGWVTAIDYTTRLLRLEPWREEAHRQMMRLLALNGQRGAALAQYEKCRQVLADELDVEPGPETTALYEQIRDGKLGGDAGVCVVTSESISSATSPLPHNLPADLTPFLGRKAELEQLNQLLTTDAIRLISIVGMGGMGKTRLALAASRQQIGNFYDGIFFVSFAQIDSPDNIPNAIADAIGFQFYSSEASQQQLANYLRQKQMLLLLDNFEHLISGSGVVAEILTAAPHIKIMVTTRQQLRLQGETRLNLSGFDVEAWENSDQARTASVGQLFLQSAQRVQSEFTLDDDNFQDVLTICHLMQGLPLGVELAAAWVDVFTLEEIINGINDEIDFLAVDFQDVPERHRSLRVVMEQSLRLLSEKEREIFLRLCVFRGGFTRDAARQVAGTDIRTLTILGNKSLVQRDTTGRYAIHELLRQFGKTSLNTDKNSYASVHNAHADYYCSFLAELDNVLNTGDAQIACREIEQELGNVHLAWEWACQHGLFDHLIKAEYAIFLFREYQNRFQEMEQMYQTAVSHLTIFEPSPKRDYVLSDVLRCQAWTALRFGQIERGLKLGLQSWDYLIRSKLPLKAVSGNDPRAPLTVLYTISGDYELARKTGEAMLKHHRERGDGVKAILAYYALSALEMAEGNYEQVRHYGQSAAKDFKATGHRYLYAYFLNNWGNAERVLGNYDEAKRLFSESCDHMHDLGSTEGMTTAFNNMAYIAILLKDYDEAQKILQQNTATYRNLGDIGGIAMSLEGLGRIAIDQSDYPRAARLFSDALQTAGSALSSITLSILTRVSRLFLETNLPEQAYEILKLVMHHPASNQEIKERAQHQIDDYGLDLNGKEGEDSLERLVEETIQCLDTMKMGRFLC
jgi:DNA-binding SARP family transcriptional activator/predicted ATPase/Tfp pilus assembly protein PilF